MPTKVEEKLTEEPFIFTEDIQTVTRLWQVRTTDELNEFQVVATTGLPQRGDELLGTDAIVTQVNGLRQIGKSGSLWHVWDVTIIYSAGEEVDTDEIPEGQNERLLNYQLSYTIRNKITTKAYKGGEIQGKPSIDILNTAGQEFDPPVSDSLYNTVLRWTQKESDSFRSNGIVRYMNTLNKSSITVLGQSIPAKQGLLRLISPVLRRDVDGKSYYETTYEIEIDKDEHIKDVRSQGFQQKKADGKLYDIHKSDINPALLIGTEAEQEEAKEKINLPADLKANGELEIDKTKAVHLKYQIKYATNWSSGLDLLRSIT